MLQRFDVRCQVLPSLNMTPSSGSDCWAEKCNLLSCHSYCRERGGISIEKKEWGADREGKKEKSKNGVLWEEKDVKVRSRDECRHAQFGCQYFDVWQIIFYWNIHFGQVSVMYLLSVNIYTDPFSIHPAFSQTSLDLTLQVKHWPAGVRVMIGSISAK